MNISSKNRKIIHFALFLSIITLQITAFTFWFSEIKNQNTLYNSIDDIVKPNEALEYSNQATKNYFEANSYFNEYLNTHLKENYVNYQNSLKKMSFYLTKLNSLSNKDNSFSQIVKSKKGVEKDIIRLKKQLDSLINKNNNSSLILKDIDFKIANYDYEKALSSITYDTTKTSSTEKKKGFFGRIGNALSGKKQTEKLEVQLVIKMVFNNQEKTGSFEDQLRNIFKANEKYYNEELSKLKKVHHSLKNKDQDLLKINKIIFSKSQEIILFYSKSAQELNKINHLESVKSYNSSLKSKKKLILILLLAISFVTLLLLLYSIYSYFLENKLEKEKLEAEISLDKKNQLIGMISHEMRAPLNIISNFSNKIKAINTNPKLNTFVDSLHFTSYSLQITVSQILDFFKNENKALQLFKTKINLKNEVSSILESLKSLAELKQINIISNIEPNLNKELWTDNVKIHQLFYNIIGNAIKFTDKGSITVDTKLIPISDNQFRFEVKITDTGTGIPKAEQDKIFNEFYQSKTHKEQISFGAGLGLTLCKNIIELFQGKIQVKSELGKGTEISFFLLLDEAHPEQETNETKLINQFKNTTKEILVVEDDPMASIIIEKLITKIKFKATTFQEVNTAKEYLENKVVDVIITDLQFFNSSGFDLIKDIKNLKNENTKSPIIVVTGDDYMLSADLKTLQIDEILIKPIDQEEFYSKMLEVLNKNSRQ